MTPAETGFRRLSERVVHQGHIWQLVRAEFKSPRDELFSRDIVRSPGAVGVVPIVFDAEGNPSVVLVSQYRAPLETEVLEIPAGMRDIEGEAPEEVALRELTEEAGLAADDLVLLTAIYPSPGLTDSVTTIFMATGCTSVATDRQGPEEQEMDVRLLPLNDALAMVERGEIRDAKTAVGLLLASRRIEAANGN